VRSQVDRRPCECGTCNELLPADARRFETQPHNLAEIARLGGRLQKLARRLRDRERYLELYKVAP
jgi:hypothetical protein